MAFVVERLLRLERPGDFTVTVRWLVVALAVMILPILGGCLGRAGGSVPLPYVKPANSVPTPPPTVPMQMDSRMQAMETELQRLWDTVERMNAAGGNRQTVARLEERIGFIEKQLGINAPVVTQPEGNRAPVGTVAPPPQKPGANAVAGSPPVVGTGAPAPTSIPVQIQNPPMSSDREDYRAAYGAYRSKAYDKALELFEAFLKNHPKSDLVPGVLYLAGEANFEMKHFEDAVLYFDRVIKEYPGSKKELTALLKQGQSFEKMGDARSARIIFEKLVSAHPHTPQAQLAAGRLKSLRAAAGEHS